MLNSLLFSKTERKSIHGHIQRCWKHPKFPPKYQFYLIDKKELIKAQSILINLGYSFEYNDFQEPIQFISPTTHDGPFGIITYNYSKVLMVTRDPYTDPDAEDIELEDLITEHVVSNESLATHVDQDRYKWRYLLSSDGWECFVNNKWLEIDLEDHLILRPLY